MCDGIVEDSDQIIYYNGDGEEVTDSDEMYEVVDESTPNPAYGCTTSNKTTAETGNPEGLHSNELSASDSCCLVETNEDRKKEKNSVVSAVNLVALVSAVVLLIAAGVAIIIAFVEISKLHFKVAVLQSTLPMQAMNIQALVNSIDMRFSDIYIQLNNSEHNLENITNCISTQQIVIDMLSSELDNNIKIIATILYADHIFSSCLSIQHFFPYQSTSGYYNIRSSNGSVITAYCDMTRSCGGITGGWMRVAELDMTNTTTLCPDSLELMTIPLRTCIAIDSDNPTCSSDMFSVDCVQYSKVCGKIRAYQRGSTNAFALRNPGIQSIDTCYVDGVSLTYGSFPRQHIWTFASAANEDD